MVNDFAMADPPSMATTQLLEFSIVSVTSIHAEYTDTSGCLADEVCGNADSYWLNVPPSMFVIFLILIPKKIGKVGKAHQKQMFTSVGALHPVATLPAWFPNFPISSPMASAAPRIDLFGKGI
jgi:hypothetical protein